MLLPFGLAVESIKEFGGASNTQYLKLMICLIDFRELMCLIKLTYIRDITKFELQKGTKKRSLVAQSMAHTNSW
jgi:hypothetical protein